MSAFDPKRTDFKGDNMAEKDDSWLTDPADHLMGVTLTHREWTPASVRAVPLLVAAITGALY